MTSLSRSTPLRRLHTRARLLTVAVLGCYATAPAWAGNLPTNMTVVSGTANPTLNGNVLSVKNSSGAILNWGTFNIGAGYTVNFDQAASSSVLNRVAVGNPTSIYGTLSSPGKVWLINPSGIMIGPGGMVNTAAFVASTLDVSNANFLAGNLTFNNTPGAGSVVNQGTITTPSGGSVYLVGANVSNEGIITTPQGETVLAAGETVNLIDTGTPGVKVEITGAAGNTTNLGQIVADAGRIGMAGVIVRNSGVLNASSVINEGGRIFLKASQDTYVDGNGRIVATGTKGGQVQVLGNRVAVMDNASIDASGINGGGTVLVGGDLHGANPDVQNATITYFGPQAAIKADATDNGDGGKVVVWADDTTRAYGNISARGGAASGNGGFVETSGHDYLDFHASVDTRAPNGQAGTLLLDPADVTITNSGTVNGSFSGGIFTNGSTPSTLNWSDIIAQLGSGNVVVTTTYGGAGGTGDITVAQSPAGGSNITISHTDSWGTWTNTWFGAGYNSANSLTLLANHAVNINALFGNAGSGAINIMAGWNGVSTTSPAMYGGFTAGQSININGGGGIVSMGPVRLSAVDTVAITGSGINGMAGIDMNAGDLAITANKISLSSNGTGVYNGTAARIASNGNQTFTVGIYNSSGGVYLQGDTGGGATYGGSAEIESFGPTSSQNFTIQNGATVQLTGGSGTGLTTSYSGDCSVAPGCTNDSAAIRSLGSSQSFTFTAGGNLNVYGGSGGNDNYASIAYRGTGTQTISGNPNILIQGGSSGGTAVYYGGELSTLDNGASIDSKYGTQNINAASITMNGGTATYGGAFLGAPTQNITVTGAVSLTGYGGGTLPAYYDAYGKEIFIDPAAIGNEVANSVNLTAGSLTLNGGNSNAYGGSPALIGGLNATNVTINTSGSIALNSSFQSGDRIGSLNGLGGSVSLTSTGGTIALGKGLVGTGASGSVSLSAYGGITQTPLSGSIRAAVLTATSTIGNISLPGNNYAGFVTASAPGGVTYTSGGTAYLGFTTSSSGTVNVTGYGGGTTVVNNGTVEPSSVTVQNLSSSYGSWADYITNNNVTVTGSNYTLTSTNGGVSLFSSGSVTLNSPTGFQPSTNPTYGFTSIWGNTGMTVSGTLSSPSDLFLGTSGNMSISSATLSGNYLGLYAAGALTATGATFNANYDAGLGASGGLTLTNSSITSLYGSVYLGSVNLVFNTTGSGVASFAGSGGNIALTGTSATASMGNVNVLTGGDVRLNSGSSLSAKYDVNLKLLGSTSTLYLGDTAGLSPSTISTSGALSPVTGLASRISVDFPLRSTDGIVLDGTSTSTTVSGKSGFYVGAVPAVQDAGLDVNYGIIPASVAVTTVNNTVTSTINNTTSNVPGTQTTTTPPPPTPTTGGGTSLTSLGTQTVGGSTGEFGGSDTSSGTSASGGGTTGATSSGNGSSSGDSSKSGEGSKSSDSGKDKKDDKKSSDASGDKKDDKSGDKKHLGKCSA